MSSAVTPAWNACQAGDICAILCAPNLYAVTQACPASLGPIHLSFFGMSDAERMLDSQPAVQTERGVQLLSIIKGC